MFNQLVLRTSYIDKRWYIWKGKILISSNINLHINGKKIFLFPLKSYKHILLKILRIISYNSVWICVSVYF